MAAINASSKVNKSSSSTSARLGRWLWSFVFGLAVAALIKEVRKSSSLVSDNNEFDKKRITSSSSREVKKRRRNRINTHYPIKWDFSIEPTDEVSTKTAVGFVLPSLEEQSHNSDKGRHVCTCLDSNPTQSPHPQIPKKNSGDYNFRWLHIPKTGTSLIITLWLHATSTNERNIPQTIDTNIDPFFRTGCTSCYDFAFMQRYPLELYGHNLHLRRHFASLHTSHEPLGALPVDKNPTTKHLVFFRESHARVVSAFDNNMHTYGNWGEHAAIKAKCANNVTCYASRPGQLGCMLRMLTGATCSVPSNSPHTMSLEKQSSSQFRVRLQRAKEAIQSMSFIGVTEEWNESLCQFHKQFGGTPLQEQFQNIRKGSRKSSVADLSPDYKDPADETVYRYAKEEFEKRIGADHRGRCYKYIENTATASDNTNNNDAAEASSCIPKTCKELGKQCGEWFDGCGGIRICGICNVETRDSLPATWRVQCSPEGQCIRTCPPWENAGLWYRPVDDNIDDVRIQEERWKSNLEGAPQDILDSATANGTTHLFPTDAVKICVSACASQDEKSKTFASKHCKCGTSPTDFLEISPTADEYHEIYNLKPVGSVYGRKPYKATLKSSDTQPKCCPFRVKPSTSLKGSLPPNKFWREGIPLADFFESYYLGCGGNIECEQLGHDHQASVVSYDPDHHFCYLGRNHRPDPDDVLDHDTRFHLFLS